MSEKRSLLIRRQEISSIWRSWSWNETGGACDQEIWSESGGVLGTASLESGTFSSCVVDCDATYVVVEAFCEEEKVCEVEDALAELARQMQ